MTGYFKTYTWKGCFFLTIKDGKYKVYISVYI